MKRRGTGSKGRRREEEKGFYGCLCYDRHFAYDTPRTEICWTVIPHTNPSGVILGKVESGCQLEVFGQAEPLVLCTACAWECERFAAWSKKQTAAPHLGRGGCDFDLRKNARVIFSGA